ncbi:MAG: preprotein translocase subunit SecE [Phycisphaerales bacterium]
MALGIYKSGQGYWVRVMTAVTIGVLAMAGAAWGWGQAAAVRLPIASYQYEITGVEGELTPGTSVDILAFDKGENPVLNSVGTGVVEEYTSRGLGGAHVRVGGFSSDDTRDRALDAKQLRATGFNGSIRDGAVTANPIFPQIYLQAGIACGILLIATVVIYWFTAVGRKPVDFLVATDGEMKKVNWSTPREIRGSTIVVIVAAFLISGILFGVDLVFRWFFGVIDVLQT